MNWVIELQLSMAVYGRRRVNTGHWILRRSWQADPPWTSPCLRAARWSA